MGYLLAAEADKIQDFIFRSSRLREVVGASQLLSRFHSDEEHGVFKLVEALGGEAVVNDGGSFRALFTGQDAEGLAQRFGEELAELYRLVMDSTLSVAPPHLVANDLPPKDNDAASQALRRAKLHREHYTAEVHMPYVAFCASCGVAPAVQYAVLPSEERLQDVQPRYLCRACQDKARERASQRSDFLDAFLEAVTGDANKNDDFTWPEDADELAGEDRRRYVAYLVADGNSMGELFGSCPNKDALHRFSKGLTGAVRRSLADATKQLQRCCPPREVRRGKKKQQLVAVLPLILGGDDLYALFPAPWALDFARCFCLAYERHVGELVRETLQDDNIFPPTVAAAVVICKSKYPYTLAHRRAHTLLKEAKRLSKAHAAEHEESLSTVNFEVILGNRLERQGAGREQAIRPTLRSYWVTESPDHLSPEAKARTSDLSVLIRQRYELRDVPNRRLNELRRRFGEALDVPQSKELPLWLKEWSDKIEPFLERSGEPRKTAGTASATQRKQPIRDALAALGSARGASEDNTHWWREEWTGQKSLYHQGLPDVLEAWDYALDMTKERSEYERSEEDAR